MDYYLITAFRREAERRIILLGPGRAVRKGDDPRPVAVLSHLGDCARDFTDVVITAPKQSAEIRDRKSEQTALGGSGSRFVDHDQLLRGKRLTDDRRLAIIAGQPLR